MQYFVPFEKSDDYGYSRLDSHDENVTTDVIEIEKDAKQRKIQTRMILACCIVFFVLSTLQIVQFIQFINVIDIDNAGCWVCLFHEEWIALIAWIFQCVVSFIVGLFIICALLASPVQFLFLVLIPLFIVIFVLCGLGKFLLSIFFVIEFGFEFNTIYSNWNTKQTLFAVLLFIYGIFIIYIIFIQFYHQFKQSKSVINIINKRLQYDIELNNYRHDNRNRNRFNFNFNNEKKEKKEKMEQKKLELFKFCSVEYLNYINYGKKQWNYVKLEYFLCIIFVVLALITFKTKLIEVEKYIFALNCRFFQIECGFLGCVAIQSIIHFIVKFPLMKLFGFDINDILYDIETKVEFTAIRIKKGKNNVRNYYFDHLWKTILQLIHKPISSVLWLILPFTICFLSSKSMPKNGFKIKNPFEMGFIHALWYLLR